MGSRKEEVLGLKEEYSTKQIADILGISQRSVQRYIKEDNDLGEIAFKAIAKSQKQSDKNLVNTKIVRESARRFNMHEELNDSMLSILEKHAFTKPNNNKKKKSNNKKAGVIQLSDVHFNEIIDDVYGNEYNFDVASARVKKLITQSIKYFKANDITSVSLFMTGDLLNSDRRLDEITHAPTNRSKAVFVAVDIIQQAIHELSDNFKHVSVASITGNESRVGKDVHWSNFLAGDSYDCVIHNMLTVLFKNHNNIKFIPIVNPLECVVNVLNTNFLLVHGHGHGRLAGTSNIETQVQNIKATYASRGVIIDYVLCGHIHQAFISDNFARSSGMPGSNSFSSAALNLSGKASQNIFVVDEDGSIDGIKICLQNYENSLKYKYNMVLDDSSTKLIVNKANDEI